MSLKQSELSNGIRVVTQERDLTGAVAYHVYFGCGGRHDPDEYVGVSHALEHMMFKGTPTRTQLDIARQMEGVGALINANTGTELTCYHFLAPAEVFGNVLAVYADAINNSLLDPQEWEKERRVILEELKMYQDMPRAWVWELLETTMFNLQVGGLGRRETIEAIATDHMRELIARWYTPAQTVISAAGRISHEEVVERSEEHFGARSSPDGSPPAPPLPAASRQRVVGQVRETDQVNLAMGFRAPGLTHPDAPALHVLCDILGGKMSSRLFSEVREKRGLAYSVSASSTRFTDAGLCALKAGVALEKASEAVRVIL
ncbi:MAG: M16 family metallopeptidase, partial [Nitrospinota bacterium]